MKKKMSGDERKDCIQLLPADVRLIRAHLLYLCPGIRTRSLENLQVYCMMLVGINLFLRPEELLQLKFSDLAPAYTGFNSVTNKIDWLVFTVNGKTDDHDHYLRLWANPCHPELCPVIHLLVYIAMSCRTDGFVFPSFDNPNRIFKYDKFLDILDFLCTKVIIEVINHDNQPRRFGPHILRKTAYLFAIFGVMENHGFHADGTPITQCADGFGLTDIMTSARHKSLQNARTYAFDAVSNFSASKQSSESPYSNLYKQWQPIHVSDLTYLERLTAHSVVKNKPLQFLAKWFYERRLFLTPEYSVLDSVRKAVDCASNTVTYQSPSDAFQNLQKYVSTNLPPQQVATINGYMKQIAVQFTIQNASPINMEAPAQEIVPTLQDQQQAQGTTSSTTTSLSSPRKIRKHRYGTVTLDFRFGAQWLELDLLTQVNKLVGCYKIPTDQLTNSARVFYYQTAVPIARCINSCFDNDIQRFIDHLQESGITKIRKGKAHKYKCPRCLQLAASLKK
jgi:integrase